jgi:succinylarginine dihydrolase
MAQPKAAPSGKAVSAGGGAPAACPVAYEVNFDGLVGPTHNYAGLSYGNIASTQHRAQLSNPQEAALQGLLKMKRLADLGMKQAVLPPQERPDVFTLRRLGFGAPGAGAQDPASDAEVLRRARKSAPEILAACTSASSMWTANAATVSPSADTADGRVHFTPANLNSKFHRSIEHETTGRALRAIFRDEKHFAHHPALPPGAYFGDEGAANHTRFCAEYGAPGVEFFVFGRYAFRTGEREPRRFPARQTYEASLAITRLHQLAEERVAFAHQNPEAIDAGVFHNDVTAVGNRDLLFYHETSYLDSEDTLQELSARFERVAGTKLRFLKVPTSAVSMDEAVKTYLFNSQLLSPPHLASQGGMALIAPLECKESKAVSAYLAGILKDPSQPIREVHYLDLRQSMNNGGGPACLRLRVVLTEQELACANPKVFMDDRLYETLCDWVRRHYRTRLSSDELDDPNLLIECRKALDELTRILGLGAIYPFQMADSFS